MHLLFLFGILMPIVHKTQGSLEYGATVNLGSKFTTSSPGWVKVEGWVGQLSSSTVQLYFTYGVTVSSQELTSNKEGIFLVSMNIYITDGNPNAQYQALVAIDEFDNIGQVQNGIRAAQKGFSSGTLYAAGYMYLRQDSAIRVYVYSDITHTYSVDVKSAITVNFQDNLGTKPGFLVSLQSAQILSSGTNNIGGWTVAGPTALFNSKGGLNLGTGKFTVTCTGLHVILSTLVLSTSTSTHVDLKLLVDGNTTYNASSKYIRTGILSIHINLVLNLNEGQTLQLWMTSNPVATLQLSKWSTFSIWHINPSSATMSDYSRTINATSTNVASGKVTDNLVKASGINQVNTAFPTSLIEQSDNTILCYDSKVYLTFLSLRLKITSAKNFTITSKVLVGSSEEVMSSSTVESGLGWFYETMSMGFVLKCDNRKLLSVEIRHNAQAGESVDILEGSSLALIESRLAYPELVGMKSKGDTVEFTAGGGSKELSSWSISMGGDYREGKQFSENTGRFTAHTTGIYYVSTSIEFSATSAPSTSVSVSVAINSVVSTKSSLTKYIGHPSDVETLSISGLLKLEKDQYVSLIIQSPAATGQLQIKISSGFFVAHMGQTSLIPAFSAYLVNEFSTSDATINVVSSNLTTDSEIIQSSFLKGEWVRDDVAGTFTAPLAGAYIVICTATLNDTAPSSSVAYYEVRIVGSNTNRRGMFDEWYSKNSSTRDFFTLNTAGVLNLALGDTVGCQLINGKSGSIRVITAGFSAALLQYSGLGTGFNTYIADASTLSGDTGYIPITKYTTTAGFPYFETDTKHLVESNGLFTADISGVLFLSGNVGIESGADTDKTYQATLKTDIESVTTYGNVAYGISGITRGSVETFSIGFTGLYEMSIGTVTSLVVVANPDDNLWKIDKGTGWSLYSFPNDSPRQPGVLDGRTSTDQIKKGAPYFVRANPYVFATKTFQPTASGLYIVRVVGYGTSGNSSLNERLHLSVNNQSFASSMYHANSTHLEVGSLVNLREGLQLNESNTQTQSFAGTFLSSTFDSEGFTSRLASQYDASSVSFYKFEGFSSFPVNNFQSGNITNQTQLTPSKTGMYFITVNIHFDASTGLNELKQNAMNSLLYSAVRRNSSSYTLRYYGFLYLENGNTFDVGIDTSEDQSFSILDGSTVSLAYYASKAQFDGFIAASSASQMLTATSTTPTILKGFDSMKNIDYTKGFYPGETTFYSYNPGVYLVTANIVVTSKSSQTSTVKVEVKYESDTDLPGLFAQDEIRSYEVATLSLMAPIYLQRWRYIGLMFSASNDDEFEILPNSTFSVVLLENDADTLCSVLANTTIFSFSNILQSIGRGNRDVPLQNSTSLVCESTYGYRANFYWYFGRSIIQSDFGVFNSTLNIANASLLNIGNYYCQIRRGDDFENSNTVQLTVIGPYPIVTPENATVSVSENGLFDQTLVDFVAAAYTDFNRTQRAILKVEIIQVSTGSNNFYIMPNTTMNSFGLYASVPFDYEEYLSVTITIRFTNMNASFVTGKYYTDVNVIINVLNVNEVPQFSNVSSPINVLENVTVNSEIATITATDVDFNTSLLYTILNGSASSYFSINQTTGVIYLIQQLDRETTDEYTMFVMVSDRSLSAFQEIKVNVLDIMITIQVFNQQIIILQLLKILCQIHQFFNLVQQT